MCACNTSTGSTKGKSRPQHNGIANLRSHALTLVNSMRNTGASYLKTNIAHGIGKELTVLSRSNRGNVTTNNLHLILFKHTGLRKLYCTVQPCLSAHICKQCIRTFASDDFFYRLRSNWLNVGSVGHRRIGHDGCGIGINQHHLIALFTQGLTCLSSGIIKLARLTNNNWTRANNQNLFNISPLGHPTYTSPHMRDNFLLLS